RVFHVTGVQTCALPISRDIIVTPLLLMIVYLCAYVARSRVPDPESRAYFLPALTVRILGALLVGIIYQFYYQGGDTLAYHTHGRSEERRVGEAGRSLLF